VRAQISVQAAALGAAFALLAGGPGVARAANPPSPPSEVISPLPGTPDANPDTQISFLGAPASHLRDISVVGSRSGTHRGRLRFYSTHTGGSFLPARAFIAGETVTVSAQVVGYGTPLRIATRFTVSRPAALSGAGPMQAATPSSPDVQHFHSRPDLQPPAVSVTTPAADPGLGDVFITADGGPGEAGAMIIAPSGQLVWFLPTKGTLKAFNLNVQSYRTQPVLTWWQGQVVAGHGRASMRSTARTTCISPRSAPATACSRTSTTSCSRPRQRLDHGLRTRARRSQAVRRLDRRHHRGRGRAGDRHQDRARHVRLACARPRAISASYMSVPRPAGQLFDFFHLNSIDPLSNGTALISARNTWATYLVSETTGNVLWQLGGKHSSFTLGRASASPGSTTPSCWRTTR